MKIVMSKFKLNKTTFLISLVIASLLAINLSIAGQDKIVTKQNTSLKEIFDFCMEQKNNDKNERDLDELDNRIKSLGIVLNEREDVDARFIRAVCYEARGNFKESIEDISYIIKMDPERLFVFYVRGKLYEQSRMYHKAIEDFTRSIEKKPNNYKAYNIRGDMFIKINRNDKAIDDFLSAVNILKKLRPCENIPCEGYSVNEVEIYLKILHLLNATNQKQKFQEIYNEALIRNPGAEKQLTKAFEL